MFLSKNDQLWDATFQTTMLVLDCGVLQKYPLACFTYNYQSSDSTVLFVVERAQIPAVQSS